MSQRKTVAVIGLSETNIILLATKIACQHTVLLFDPNSVLLHEVYSQMHSKNPNGNIEIMNCPIDASWEADVILFSDSYLKKEELLEKIRIVITGKVVLVLLGQKEIIKLDSTEVTLRGLFPFSKIIPIYLTSDSNNDSLFLKDIDNKDIQSVLTFLSTIDLKINS